MEIRSNVWSSASIESEIAPQASDRKTSYNPHAAGAHGPPVRQKRGGALGKCMASTNSEFRESRGGDLLKIPSSGYIKFDQIDYRRTRNGAEGRGMCEGITLEAIRRIDRNDAANLMDAVTYMRSDGNLGGNAATEMFDRIDNFQDNRNSPGFRRYERTSPFFFTAQPGQSTDQRSENLLDQLHRDLRGEGDIAVVRLGLRQTGRMESRAAGHALLVSRDADNHYTVFDPNNGAFRYRDEQDMRSALRSYIEGAFAEAGYEVEPESVQFYRPRQQQRPLPEPLETQLPPPTLPEPSIALFPRQCSGINM